MKRLLFTASLIFSCAAAQALPKPEQFPANLINLQAADISKSSFGARMKAQGVDFDGLVKMLPAEVQAEFQTNAVLRALTEFRSGAFAITADSKTGNPDGFVAYADGAFDAPALIQALIDLPDVQKALKEEADCDDFFLKTGRSALGPTLVLTCNATDIPEKVLAFIPALRGHFTLTLEAVAPDTLRFSSPLGLSGKDRPALAASSPFAKMLEPANGFFFREKTVFPEKLVSEMMALQLDALPPSDREMVGKFFDLPLVKTFLKNYSYEVDFSERGDRVQYVIVIDAASPEDAEEIQEAVIGYKVLLKTLIDVLAANMGEFTNSEASASLMDVLKSAIAGIKVSVLDENRVLAKSSLTIGQCAEFAKVVIQLAEQTKANAETASKAAECVRREKELAEALEESENESVQP